LNVLAIDPKIACSRFDTEFAGRQPRTAMVQKWKNALLLGMMHKNSKNASTWCTRSCAARL
jgi:hypothetical protein